MEEEIEDLIGEVSYRDSENSIPVVVVNSHDSMPVYSPCDFEDTSSEVQHSSCKGTYVIDVDDTEVSDGSFVVENSTSVSTMNGHELKSNAAVTGNNKQLLRGATNALKPKRNGIKRFAQNCSHYCSTESHESFTQTSKTIIEIAHTEGLLTTTKTKSLETQTSLICISENKNNSSIENSGGLSQFSRNEIVNKSNTVTFNTFCQILNTSLDDGSSKFPFSETEVENRTEGSDISSDYMTFENEPSKDNLLGDNENECNQNTSDILQFTESDFEEDSLMTNDQNESPAVIIDTSENNSNDIPDNDVKELYHKLTENINTITPNRSEEIDIRRFSTLTPLSEETTTKKGSIIDITPTQFTNDPSPKNYDKDVLFTNSFGINVKILPDESKPMTENMESFKLPQIQRNASLPTSPLLNLLFAVNSNSQPLSKAETSPCLYKRETKNNILRWGMDRRELASGSGESTRNNAGRDLKTSNLNNLRNLTPIHIEGQIRTLDKHSIQKSKIPESEISTDKSSISINKKINELKVINKNRSIWRKAHSPVRSSGGEANSPDSIKSGVSNDIAEKGCDALCQDLLKRLRSHSWFDVVEALNDVPKALSKYWSIISEKRIADLIRQITSHVESPRSQVAKTACGTLAEVLKNTNYTRKPDFYEAVSILLIKTGSYSMPVRRAANVALDEIVCNVDLSHAVTALCIHGAGHKSPLVRCAASRLLVVCAALSSGGRELLRSRPTVAAIARRQALRALSMLLDDKNIETRKYAERLYMMLRPLPHFEAYYLTDVQVELASAHMKKYDQLLQQQVYERGAV